MDLACYGGEACRGWRRSSASVGETDERMDAWDGGWFSPGYIPWHNHRRRGGRDVLSDGTSVSWDSTAGVRDSLTELQQGYQRLRCAIPQLLASGFHNLCNKKFSLR